MTFTGPASTAAQPSSRTLSSTARHSRSLSTRATVGTSVSSTRRRAESESPARSAGEAICGQTTASITARSTSSPPRR
jgi:hypothetical protein